MGCDTCSGASEYPIQCVVKLSKDDVLVNMIAVNVRCMFKVIDR